MEHCYYHPSRRASERRIEPPHIWLCRDCVITAVNIELEAAVAPPRPERKVVKRHRPNRTPRGKYRRSHKS